LISHTHTLSLSAAQVNRLLAEGTADDSEALIAEQSELMSRLEALDCWSLSADVATASAHTPSSVITVITPSLR